MIIDGSSAARDGVECTPVCSLQTLLVVELRNGVEETGSFNPGWPQSSRENNSKPVDWGRSIAKHLYLHLHRYFGFMPFRHERRDDP